MMGRPDRAAQAERKVNGGVSIRSTHADHNPATPPHMAVRLRNAEALRHLMFRGRLAAAKR
jgi:hypothetical protein